MRRAILIAAVALSACGSSATTGDDAGGEGCVKDTDCKGERVCQAGRCVGPAPWEADLSAALDAGARDQSVIPDSQAPIADQARWPDAPPPADLATWPDGEGPPDLAVMVDGGESPDQGVVVDGGPPPDQAVIGDQSMSLDQLPRFDMPIPPDLAPPPDLSNAPKGIFAGYFQTWSEGWKANGADTSLAHMPGYVNVVILAFMKPDPTYPMGGAIAPTGIEVPYDAATLKQAIAALRQRQPNTEVLVAVGGATYQGWAQLDTAAIVRFVTEFGLDGVDVDYEPLDPRCQTQNGKVSCATDAEFVRIIKALRLVLPRPKKLTAAVWSLGAYGEAPYANAQPAGAYTGHALAVLAQAGADIDRLHVMSYDASNQYDPKLALAAYQSRYQGPILMGVEVPPEAWGGHVYTVAEVEALADEVIARRAAGMMLWSLQKQPQGQEGPGNPGAQRMAQAICGKLQLGGCQMPLP